MLKAGAGRVSEIIIYEGNLLQHPSSFGSCFASRSFHEQAGEHSFVIGGRAGELEQFAV